jgi:hypothetical protein
MLIEILIVWMVGIPLTVVALAILGARARAALSTPGPDVSGQSNRKATVLEFRPIRLEPSAFGRQTSGPRVARHRSTKSAL